MSLLDTLNASRVRFVVGKGGVGKTTMTAALGLAGAALGVNTHLIELEGRDELAKSFDSEVTLSAQPSTIYRDLSGSSVSARYLSPEAALDEWMREHGFGRLLPRLSSTGALEIIATAIPGIRDVLILGKIKALARDGGEGVFIVDAPATGHSLSLLASPATLVDAARSGPIRRQAEEVAAMLTDETRCSASIVTVATELAVTEAIEASFALEDRAGVALTNVIVNQFRGSDEELRKNISDYERSGLPGEIVAAMSGARAFTLARADEEQRQRERLLEELPLDQLVVPHVESGAITLSHLQELAGSLIEGAS